MTATNPKRTDLVAQIHDRSLRRHDRDIAARAIVRAFPAAAGTVSDLVLIVCPLSDPPPDVFDILADAVADVRGNVAIP